MSDNKRKMKSPQEMLESARNAFRNNKTKSYSFRLKQLKNLLRLYEENTDAMFDALRDDLSKSKQESHTSEIDYLKNDARNMLYNLKKWMQPEYKEKSIATIMDTVMVVPEPYGVVLVMGAWNYPLQLVFAPLAGAIAAGNCAILKPSELAPNSAKLIAELVPKYLDCECYHVYQGGVPETQALLQEKFDYIFFTGSTNVGRIVYEAAAKHLTPVTLELGGKSPVYIDASVDLDIAVPRIMWGKLLNAGQSCIAPDYVLCTPEVQAKFVEVWKTTLESQYGIDKLKQNPDFGRIVNETHFNRVVKLLEGCEIAHGGDYDAITKYIQPTLCTNVDPNSPLMQGEIFGPILPIVTVTTPQRAVDFINAREKPLALYIFSNNKLVQDLFLGHTSSGGVCINDTMMHFACESLPFGGVGSSGLGAYHGKHSFDTYSHKKPVLKKDINRLGEALQMIRYPPFSDTKLGLLNFLIKKRPSLPFVEYLLPATLFGLGFLTHYVLAAYKSARDGRNC